MRGFLWLCWGFAGLALVGCQDSSTQPSDFQLNFRADAQQVFSQVDRIREFTFPRDHGPHEDFRNEWWYLTSILETAEGRKFGAQFTLFRQALGRQEESSNPWRSSQIYLAHFAISDIEAESHTSFERLSRSHPRLAGVNSKPFRAFLDDWELKSSGEAFAPLKLRVKDSGYELNLDINLTKPIALHGNQGLSRKGPTNFTYYYSIPRMASTGYVSTPEGRFNVSGHSWLDREWMSALLSNDHTGWDWFSLQLYDGRDVVLFRLRSKNPRDQEHGVGMVIDQNGSTVNLTDDEWSIQPLEHWRRWPVEWNLVLHDADLIVRPAFENQLMTTSIEYWEGVVFLYDGSQVVGEGYLELTGY